MQHTEQTRSCLDDVHLLYLSDVKDGADDQISRNTITEELMAERDENGGMYR